LEKFGSDTVQIEEQDHRNCMPKKHIIFFHCITKLT